MIELEVLGLVEAQQALEAKFESFDAAVARALVVVGQRGHDYLLEHAPVLTGAYRRSVSLEVTPDGDVKVSIDVRYAKTVEKHQGVFNAMIKATMSRKHVLAEISRQMELVP